MRTHIKPSMLAIAVALSSAPVAALAQDDAQPAEERVALDEIVVTAQRRETGIQDTSVAVAAVTGEDIVQDNIQSYEDLAASVASLSFTALSPLDHEYNIRGITNTRLDSPSADQSVGIFIDNVYVGRSGLLNTDFFDVERVEVIRGPQGVLLGRNVVGGAISIITAKPEFEPSAQIRVQGGNYGAYMINGYATGALSDRVAGRIAAQYRKRDGYNTDILHNRDLDNLKSLQVRGSLLVTFPESGAEARLTVDYMDDESNGFHSVALDDPNLPGQGPWSTSRDAIAGILGGLDVRDSFPEHPLYKGDPAPTDQQVNREAIGVTLSIDAPVMDGKATFSSITGYRGGEGFNVYDQTGLGPDNGFGIFTPLAFSFPVNEKEKIAQFSQELRLTSALGESRWDYIVGAYFQSDSVDKFDRFWAEVPLTVLSTLSGESTWDNHANNQSYAVFGQLGYQLNDQFRLVGGVRYSNDSKDGRVTGTAVETGDKFNPNDTVALTPLAATFAEGEIFTTDYGEEWSEVTPQVTLEYTPRDNLFFYATYSRGYKGGGYEDDPANAIAARTSYDPETVNNYEAGAKIDFLDNRARVNLAAFFMEYQDLQVTQTDDGCLCNITDNAADAEITGFEGEFQLQATDQLFLFGAVTVLDTEYLEFIDSNGLDASGNQLQRTPEYQYNFGGELTLDAGSWRDALNARLTYSYKGDMFWSPENIQMEEGYGLLNARLSLDPQDKPWSISIWGRNITDELYRTNIIAFLGDEVSRLGAPATYGFEFGYRW